MMSRGGDSTTQGSLPATSKNTAPVSRTVFKRSDSASAGIGLRCPVVGPVRPREFWTTCQAIRTPDHSLSHLHGLGRPPWSAAILRAHEINEVRQWRHTEA